MMNKTIVILLFSLLYLSSSFAQVEYELNWNDFEIVAYKKVKVEILGSKSKVKWSLFNDSIYTYENKTVRIEGYYQCLESVNPETLEEQEICIITIDPQPTIVICGVEQYRQNEFIRVARISELSNGQKVKLEGILHLNRDGSSEPLISMENALKVD